MRILMIIKIYMSDTSCDFEQKKRRIIFNVSNFYLHGADRSNSSKTLIY